MVSLPQGLALPITLLTSGLIGVNFVYWEVYSLESIIKSLLVIGVGWLSYRLLVRHFDKGLSQVFEQFNHLIGVMSLMLVLIYCLERS
jgi:multicomponent Na+:H+ antiporter subunit D